MKRSLLLSFAAMVLGLGLPGCAYVEGDEDGECSDGVDNDQDGTLDCGDPGCISAAACAGDDDDSASDDDDSASDDDDGSPDETGPEALASVASAAATG